MYPSEPTAVVVGIRALLDVGLLRPDVHAHVVANLPFIDRHNSVIS